MEMEVLLDQMIGVVPLRHKPTPVEAMEVIRYRHKELVEWIKSHGGSAFTSCDQHVHIQAIDGQYRTANIGDWVIRGTVGEFYPITAEVKANNYEDRVRHNYG